MDDDNAAEIKKHLDEVVRRFEVTQSKMPEILALRDTATWQLSMSQHIKRVSPSVARELNSVLGSTFADIKSGLPMLPDYGVTFSGTGTNSSTVAGVSATFESAISIRDPECVDLALDELLTAYAALQAKQGRIEETRQRLLQLFPNLVEQFNLAAHSYRIAIAMTDRLGDAKAANAMRNVVNGLHGELLAKAKRHPEENNPTIEKMADRLANDHTKRRLFIEHGNTRGSLISTLSNIIKNRPISYTLKDCWPRFLDHVYIVTGCLL